MLLVSAVVLPLAGLGTGLLWHQYQSDRQRAEGQLVSQARALAQLVDREFERSVTVAQTLASSTALAHGDLDALEGEMGAARDLLSAGLPPGTPPAMLRLVREDGTRLLDTSWRPGERRMDRVDILPHMVAALASGRPALSDMFFARLPGLPFAAIAVPVRWPGEEGTASAIIGISVPRERFLAITQAAGLPPGGFASVLDRRSTTVARSFHDEETLGKLPVPAVRAAIAQADAGMAPPGTRTLEGVPSAIAFARARGSGYVVKLDIPEETFLGPLQRSLLRSALVGAVVLAAGLSIAVLVAGRVVSAIRRVPGLAMDASGPWTRSTGLREADELAATVAATLQERHQAQLAQQESERRFRTLADSMPQMVWSAGAGGRHDYFNARWYAFSGLPEDAAEGQDWKALVHPDDRPGIEAGWRHSLRSAEPYEAECRLRRHDGAYRWILARALPMRNEAGRVLRWFGSLTEIQELVEAREVMARGQRELEGLVSARTRALESARADLAQAQRMEALGQLAGGIAHDFNNVLQAVQGGASLIGRRAEDAEQVRRLSRMVTEATERGVTITRRLLTFARRSDLHAEPIDAAALLANMREILAHTLGRGIEVRVLAPEGLPPLVADRGQLETVLVNLAANARDAMSGTGLLTLSAAPDPPGREGAPARPAALEAGSYVRITVSDTGMGMDAATLARASEPFFTTKSPGRGTGLGLSMAKGFAEQSGGHLLIESSLGVGTEVTLWLPVPTEASPAPPPEAERPLEAEPDGRRILLVEDEALIRAVLAEQLELAGYTVTTTASGGAALEVLRQGMEIDLVISDLSMPGMDGLTLIQELQRCRPGLPAVLLTGFVTDAAEIALGGALSGRFSLLNKPVDARRLLDRIAVMLEASGGRADIS